MAAAKTKRKTCGAKTVRGTKCKSTAVLEDGRCMAHQPKEVQEERGFGGSQPGSGAPRKPRAIEILREKVEADVDRVLAPLLEGLTADKAVTVSGGKDAGWVEMVADAPTRIKAANDILDRVFGKAKQTTEIAGPDGGPVRVEVPRTGERAAEVARILAGAGALPGSSSPSHEGRARRSPAQAPARPTSAGNGNGNGHV
jgi:hypothetical protein